MRTHPSLSPCNKYRVGDLAHATTAPRPSQRHLPDRLLLVIIVRIIIITRHIHILRCEPFHELFELGIVRVADDFGLVWSVLH